MMHWLLTFPSVMTHLIAEIGINHNGNFDLCKKIISVAAAAGFPYAKIQKRNPDVCVPEHMKEKRRQTPWGEMSYIEYKHRVEFSRAGPGALRVLPQFGH